MAETPDETSACTNKEESSQSHAVLGTMTETQPIPHSVVVVERDTVETVETVHMTSNICQMGASTLFCESQEEKTYQECPAVVNRKRSATFFSRNISKNEKNGLMKLKELLHRISDYRCRKEQCTGSNYAFQ